MTNLTSLSFARPQGRPRCPHTSFLITQQREAVSESQRQLIGPGVIALRRTAATSAAARPITSTAPVPT